MASLAIWPGGYHNANSTTYFFFSPLPPHIGNHPCRDSVKVRRLSSNNSGGRTPAFCRNVDFNRD